MSSPPSPVLWFYLLGRCRVGWGACLLGGGWLWALKLFPPPQPPVPLWQGIASFPLPPIPHGLGWEGLKLSVNGWKLPQAPLEGMRLVGLQGEGVGPAEQRVGGGGRGVGLLRCQEHSRAGVGVQGGDSWR